MNLWMILPVSFYDFLWSIGARHFPMISLAFYFGVLVMFYFYKAQRKPLTLFLILSLVTLMAIVTYWAHRNAFIMPLLLFTTMFYPLCMVVYCSWAARDRQGIVTWLLAFSAGSLFSLGSAAWYVAIART